VADTRTTYVRRRRIGSSVSLRNILDAAEQCVVTWTEHPFWTSGDTFRCERDVDAIMVRVYCTYCTTTTQNATSSHLTNRTPAQETIAEHAVYAEACDVIDELIEVAGGAYCTVFVFSFEPRV
jgi:hypothetical protein